MLEEVCLALLDLIEKNPISRLPSSQYKTVAVKINFFQFLEFKKRFMYLIQFITSISSSLNEARLVIEK